MSGGLNQDDSKLVFESSEAVKVISTFDELQLKEDLLRGIYAYSMSVILESSNWFAYYYNLSLRHLEHIKTLKSLPPFKRVLFFPLPRDVM